MYAWTGLVAGTVVAVAFVPWPYAAGGFIVGLGALLCWCGARRVRGCRGDTEHTGADIRLLYADGRDCPWAEGTLVERWCATSAAIRAAMKDVTAIVTKTTPRGLLVTTLGVKPCGRCDSV